MEHQPEPVTDPSPAPHPDARGSTWIRLRTLINLRWIAIAGQGAALLAAELAFGLSLPLGACAAMIGLSVLANLVFMATLPASHRLREHEALAMLCFDLAQLGGLLALTGGTNNPFALLIVVPVTVAATALSTRSTALVGLLALIIASLAALFHIPLSGQDGRPLQVPQVLQFGFWLSIVIGVVFMSLYARRISDEIRSMSEGLLATQMALAREQKLTDLGGVVAAAAHELGTPLATIKLVSAELIEDLADRPDLAALREDAELIRDQADRCRDILRSMGRAGKDDLQMRQVPLEALLREVAEPHMARGKTIIFDLHGEGDPGAAQPLVRRRPEIIHGLRNLVQNAVDFAQTTVWIDGIWGKDLLVVRILDDGKGYPLGVLGRIGDPFLKLRPEGQPRQARPEYEGMGLGLFIAKTLLERSGAELHFANGSDPFLNRVEHPARSGAIVEIVWPLAAIEARRDAISGENRQIDQ